MNKFSNSKIIYFPSSYKKALLSKSKSVTIRTSDEIGKYEKSKIYNAYSYAGKNWHIKVRVVNVFNVEVGKLSEFGIPKRSIDSLVKKENLLSKSKVDLIKFEIL